MFVKAGVAYDYFFKEHPRNFFSWLKLLSKGAQQDARLSEPALTVSKNISKVAGFCQYGIDIPYSFYSFREISSDQSPKWVQACRVANSTAFIWGFGKHHIFGQPNSILGETVEAVTDLVINGYGLYIFISKRHEELQPLKRRHVAHAWDTQKIVLLVHKVSNFVLAGLALFSLYKGVDEYAPNFTIFFTTFSLSSHFLYHFNRSISKNTK